MRKPQCIPTLSFYVLWCLLRHLNSAVVSLSHLSFFFIYLCDSEPKCSCNHANILSALEIERSAPLLSTFLSMRRSPTLYVFPFASFSGIGYFTIHFVCFYIDEITRENAYKKCRRFSFRLRNFFVALHRLCRQVKLTLETGLMYTFKVFVNCC